MNSNVWIFLAVLSGILICFGLGIGALCSRARVPQRICTSLALFILLGTLLGGISLTWNMTHHPQAFTSSSASLPEQSQVIFQSWTEQPKLVANGWIEQNTSVVRSSLSGKDGTMHWHKSDQSPCTDYGISTVSDGILYLKGVLPQQQAVCIQATRLSDETLLWSTTIRSTESAANLAPGLSSIDSVLVANGRLYFQINETFFLLDASNGKILHTIQPAISGEAGAAIEGFKVNNQALVILYLVFAAPERPDLSRIVTLQPTTGEALWKSTPSLYDDLIALQGNTLYAYSKNKEVVALDVHNASQVWQTNLPNLWIRAGSANAARLYVKVGDYSGSGDGSVYALDAHSGQVLWKVPISNAYEAIAPIEANGIVYIGDTNTLSAYKATTGKLLWRYQENPLPNDSIIFNPYEAIYFSQPVILGNVIFVEDTFAERSPSLIALVPPFCLGQCSPPFTGILALNATSGKLYWRHEVPTSSSVALLAVSTS